MRATALLFGIALLGYVAAVDAADGESAWGETSRGLATRVEATSHRFVIGDKIDVTFVKKNVSIDTLEVWHSGFWPNHRIRVCDAAGRLVEQTTRGQQTYQAFSPGGDRDKNYSVKVLPGKEDASEGGYNIAELYKLTKPGQYSVQYVYEEYQGGWQGQVSSNVWLFEIVEK